MAKTTWREFGANRKITLGHCCFLFKKKEQKENYRLLIGGAWNRSNKLCPSTNKCEFLFSIITWTYHRLQSLLDGSINIDR
jgi:hypothetical protein